MAAASASFCSPARRFAFSDWMLFAVSRLLAAPSRVAIAFWYSFLRASTGAKNKKAVEDADKALRDARFAEAQAAAKAQEAEDKIRVEKSKLEKKIQDKIAEIKVLNAQLAEISKQRIALEAKAKELDVVVTSAKQVKDAADQDLKDLEESIAKLKKIIAKLLELAK